MASRHGHLGLILTAVLGAALGGSRIAPTSQSKAVTLRGYPHVGAPAAVTLLKAGTAPQRRLRYKVTPGSRIRISTTVDYTGSTFTVAGQTDPTPVVEEIVAEVLVTGVAANGDIAHDVTLVDYKVEPNRDTPARNELLLAAKGLAVTSERGIMKSMEWKPTNEQVSFFTSALQDLSVPFPEEAVGVVRRWEVRQGLLTRVCCILGPRHSFSGPNTSWLLRRRTECQ